MRLLWSCCIRPTKTDLLNIAGHYALTSVKPSMLKHDIKNILIKTFVGEKIHAPSVLSSVLITQTDLQLQELESSDRFG